jgi:hypothetical protein
MVQLDFGSAELRVLALDSEAYGMALARTMRVAKTEPSVQYSTSTARGRNRAQWKEEKKWYRRK